LVYLILEQKKTNPEENEIQKHSQNLEDCTKAVEKDFIKQEENFRKRLAMRKNGALMIEKLSSSSMADEFGSIIKSMNRIRKSESYDNLKRAKTVEENNPQGLYMNLDNILNPNDLNRSTDIKNKVSSVH